MMTGEAEKAHEYIDLEETKQKILRVAEKNYERKPEKLGMIHAAHIVKNMPAADVALVVHGKWEFPIFADGNANDPRCKCSECGSIETPLARHKYCPNCGAKDGWRR